jgi:hypothetical protein
MKRYGETQPSDNGGLFYAQRLVPLMARCELTPSARCESPHRLGVKCHLVLGVSCHLVLGVGLHMG